MNIQVRERFGLQICMSGVIILPFVKGMKWNEVPQVVSVLRRVDV